MSPTIIDAQERALAIDPTQSFCITAPAGSGKTELLTQRLLALLANVEHPEEVLAITFTRKAVAEMRERVISALLEASSADDSAVAPHRRQTLALANAVLARDRDKNWQLMQNPGRLRVFTFDAFSAWLVSQMPVSSRFGGRATLSDAPDTLYAEAVDDLLAGIDSDVAIADDLALVLNSLDCKLEQLHGLLAGLLGRRDQWRAVFANVSDEADAKEVLQFYLEQSVERVLGQLRTALTLHASSLCELLDFAAVNLCAQNPDHEWSCLLGIAELPAGNLSTLKQWHLIANLLLTGTGSWRKKVDKRNGFLPKSHKPAPRLLSADFSSFIDSIQHDEMLLPLLQELLNIPLAGYGEQNWQHLQALVNVLRHLLARLELVFQQQQKVDFSAISLQALAALGSYDEASELALRLDYQVKHILVDEFQDTSSLQFELLGLLTREWQGQDKTLFVVGDAMQSIYAFRNARVGLFMAARRYGIGEVALRELALRSNFRSSPIVVDWVNQRFQAIFPVDDDLRLGASRFVEATAAREEDASSEVCAFRYDASEGRDIEAVRICALLQQQSTGSRAILLRNRAQARHIIPALRAAGIPWKAAELDRLSDQPVVLDLMALTRMLLNPADRIAWLAVLRSPLLGLNLSEMLAIAQAADGSFIALLQDPQRWEALDTSLRSKCASLRSLLLELWQQRQRKTLAYEVNGLWQALDGDVHYAQATEQACATRYLQQLRVLTASEQHLDWALLQQAVDQLYADVSDADPNAVEILTIHKSKGLEFDTVILPALDAGTRGDEQELLSWFDPVEADGRASLLLGLNDGSKDRVSMYRYVRYLKAQQQLLETRRLLYVACTRAAKRLYLFAAYKLDKNDEPAMPAERSLAGALWPNTETGRADFLALENLHDELVTQQGAVPVSTQQVMVQRMRRDNLLAAYRGEEVDDESRPQVEQHLFERHIGTVVHRNLQRLTELGVSAWRAQSGPQLQKRWRTQLRQLGVAPSQLASAEQWVARALDAVLEDSEMHWLFRNDYRESLTEQAVTLKTSRGLQHYVIDRSFIDEAACRWIVDYKTVLNPATEGEDFETAIREQYETQLHAYRDVYRVRGERSIKLALYLPLQQQLLMLD